jgi:haloacetate dehalogenase
LAGGLLPHGYRCEGTGAPERKILTLEIPALEIPAFEIPAFAEQKETDMRDLFPGFESQYVSTPEGSIFCRIGGPKTGEPLVLLHGFSQTHVIWHKIAPVLAQTRRVIAMDLRGYGWSSVPRSDTRHETYSKREMAKDVIHVVEELGHTRFALAGHDRGGRVSYRLALDHPGRISRLALLDIIPTIAMWERIESAATPMAAHWPFLALPEPEPETVLLADPVGWLDQKLSGWSKAKDLSAFDAGALRAYRDAFAVPERIHAFCEDYRAGATRDREQDKLSRERGEKIDCPVHILWGDAGIPASGTSPLDAWKDFAPDATGEAIDSGHFLTDENPAATLAALERFFG